ncbi:MAG TPA: RNA polymerase-binding protein RbpA [Mycobacteriales bacterium]|nr:RNA polymerase-binding protein RbpA [Mycobacteriales bacterium]
MSDRVLRGSRLGAISYETDRNTELAPRAGIFYDCPKGHHFAVPMAAEADIPATWDCRQCGAPAALRGGPEPELKKTKPARTHMDMLRERRSTADLEEVLKEQLAVLHKKKKSA